MDYDDFKHDFIAAERQQNITDVDSNILAVNFKNKNKTECFPIIETVFRDVVFAPGDKSLETPHIGLTNAKISALFPPQPSAKVRSYDI